MCLVAKKHELKSRNVHPNASKTSLDIDLLSLSFLYNWDENFPLFFDCYLHKNKESTA